MAKLLQAAAASSTGTLTGPGESHLSDDLKSIIEEILEAGEASDGDSDLEQSLTVLNLATAGQSNQGPDDSFSSKASLGPFRQGFRDADQRCKCQRIGAILLLLLFLGGAACATIVFLGLEATTQDQTNEFHGLAGEVVYQVEEALAVYTRTGLWIHQAQSSALQLQQSSSLPWQHRGQR